MTQFTRLKDKRLKTLRNYTFLLVSAWTVILGASLGWNLHLSNEQAMELARNEARANFNKDQGFRLWGTRHGGVYVPITEETPPSPYMAHIPERDISTPSGKALTLMNPAYMVRQLMEDYENLYGVKGKITGLITLRPQNAPDEWETRALNKLKAADKEDNEVLEIADIHGEPYLRMMRPMYMKPGCDKCHGHLGFKTGDFRGGVTVSLPLTPFFNRLQDTTIRLSISHAIIWCLGLIALMIGRSRIEAQVIQAINAEYQLQHLNEDLENRIEERTKDLEHELITRSKAEQKARNHEQRLEMILETAADGVITMRGNGTIETFNYAAEQMFGFKAKEVIDRDISILMPESQGKHHHTYVDRFLRSVGCGMVGNGRELVAKRKNGEIFPIYLGLSHLNENGEHFFTAIVRDMSVQKKAEAELRDARDLAEAANHAKTNFLSSMSHELRTPLNSILGFSQLLRDDTQDRLPQDKLEFVNLIHSSGAHLLGLINDILDLSRIEAGKLHISVEPIDILSVARESLDMVHSLANKSKVSLHASLPETPDGLFIRADAIRFKQILVNLLNNAIKYNRTDGSVSLSMEVTSLESTSGWVRILVTDTGPGIPEEKQNDLFEPFNRLGAEASDIEGSGIGLTITKTLVELMHGSIGVESTIGTGTTFWVEFPLISLEERLLQSTAPIHAHESENINLDGNYRALYIEDNLTNRKVMQAVFDRYPQLELICATSGEEGIALAKASQLDLILLDMNLPDMDGLSVYRNLKDDPETQHLPVIAVSANAMDSQIKKALEAGIKEYITKPIDMSNFIRVLEKALG